MEYVCLAQLKKEVIDADPLRLSKSPCNFIETSWVVNYGESLGIEKNCEWKIRKRAKGGSNNGNVWALPEIADLYKLWLQRKPIGQIKAVAFKKHNCTTRRKCVYLIQSDAIYCKIGKCENLYNRLSTLVHANPHILEILGYVDIEDNSTLEKELQSRYKHRLHRNEWYFLREDEIQEILTLFQTLQDSKRNSIFDRLLPPGITSCQNI